MRSPKENPMKFHRERNAEEMTQLLDYVACFAISSGIASVFGLSWLLGFPIVVMAFKSRRKKHPFLSGRLQALTILAFCFLSLAGSYSAYCEGVSAGFDAARSAGKDRANQSAETTAVKCPPSNHGSRPAVSHL